MAIGGGYDCVPYGTPAPYPCGPYWHVLPITYQPAPAVLQPIVIIMRPDQEDDDDAV